MHYLDTPLMFFINVILTAAARLQDTENEQQDIHVDDDNEEVQRSSVDFGDKMGAKKRAKLEAKAEKKAAREAEQKIREEKRKREAALDEERRKQEEQEQVLFNI